MRGERIAIVRYALGCVLVLCCRLYQAPRLRRCRFDYGYLKRAERVALARSCVMTGKTHAPARFLRRGAAAPAGRVELTNAPDTALCINANTHSLRCYYPAG